MGSESWAVPVALGAAAAYAAASALQHFEARRSSVGDSVAMAGMLGLVRRPLWLLGSIADLLGLGLHVLALALGPISLVQPLQVTGLLFALPFGGLLTGRWPRRTELVAAGGVVAGLALFLGVARPRASDMTLSSTSAALLSVISVAVLAVGTWGCRRLRGPRRAVLMAALAGAGFAAGSVLLEDLGRLQQLSGWSAVWSGPGLPALLGAVVLGVICLGLSQAAFQIGTLGQALPVLTVLDPVIAIALAAVLLQETFPLTATAIALDGLSLVLVTAGVMVLARREDDTAPASVARPTGTDQTASMIPSGLLQRAAPNTATTWGAAAVSGCYGLLPALVALSAMSHLDSDSGVLNRIAVLLGCVSLCAGLGAASHVRPQQ